MPRVKAPGSAPGPLSLPRARRVLTHYVATCKDCDELPTSPRQATAHATAETHTVVETKHFVVAMDSED